MEKKKESEETTENVLTGIDPLYTLAATDERSELDGMMIKHFLNTLAEAALSIAARRGDTR